MSRGSPDGIPPGDCTISLGGCVVSEGNPEWKCTACGHEFGSLT